MPFQCAVVKCGIVAVECCLQYTVYGGGGQIRFSRTVGSNAFLGHSAHFVRGLRRNAFDCAEEKRTSAKPMQLCLQ
eukprot:1679181-Rhodomonas_salina.4